MNKIMEVTVQIEVDENVDSTDIRENINNLDYLSESKVEVVNVEFVKWK